jgi:membrane-associated phospholipid phosphatase
VSRWKFVWVSLAALAIVLTVAAANLPYFPGDVAVARFVQLIVPGNSAWAEWVTETAKVPGRFVLLAISLLVAWFLGRWRAVLLAAFSFGGMLGLEGLLKATIDRPRPSPDLIEVIETSKSSSFPSTFALVYAATFGFLAILSLASQRGSKTSRLSIFVVCCLILLVGVAARIVLGSHWPSDMLLSYLISGLWSTLLIYLFGGRDFNSQKEDLWLEKRDRQQESISSERK